MPNKDIHISNNEMIAAMDTVFAGVGGRQEGIVETRICFRKPESHSKGPRQRKREEEAAAPCVGRIQAPV
jgi:hypothetical protein